MDIWELGFDTTMNKYSSRVTQPRSQGASQAMLYGVGPADPLTFVSVGITLSLVALLSSLVPAWRAMRVNPVVALKTE